MPKHIPMSQEIYQYILEKRLLYSKGNYLEIGSWTGGGICFLAENFPYKNFYSVESFIQEPEISVNKFIENTNDIKNIHLISMNSIVFNKFINGNSSFFNLEEMNIDTILIDGSHIYNDVVQDIDTSIKILQNKIGFIFFHDYVGKDDVKKAVNEFKISYKNQILFEDINGDASIFLTQFK